MKKVFYLAFCAVLSLGVGCALTNYALITDNDQVSNGQGTGVVNTNGKALVKQSSQVATLWPDGADNSVWFVDQGASGDRVLTTYNNFSSAYPIFSDDLYCSPDRQGCAMITAQDPEIGDADIFDYSWNSNCSGSRSLSVLLSTSRYYGECGRAVPSLNDRLSMLYQGRATSKWGLAGLRWDMTPANSTVVLDNLAGNRTLIPMTGAMSLVVVGNGMHNAILDASNPALKAMGDYAANWAQNYSSHQNQISFTYNGIEFKQSFGFVSDPAKAIRSFTNAKF